MHMKKQGSVKGLNLVCAVLMAVLLALLLLGAVSLLFLRRRPQPAGKALYRRDGFYHRGAGRHRHFVLCAAQGDLFRI